MARRLWGDWSLALGKTIQYRQCKGRCLAGAGLGASKHIFPLENDGNRAGLNGSGGVVTRSRDRANDGLCEPQFMKVHVVCVLGRPDLEGFRWPW